MQNAAGTPFTLPDGGGLNSPQISSGDMDLDGRLDYLIYDRETSRVTVLTRASDGSFFTNHDLQNVIPPQQNWLLMRDFNGDGRPDLFTGVDDNIAVYRNFAPASGTGPPLFVLITSRIISTSLSGAPLELTVMRTDVPTIEDMDGDGDLDIVSFAYFASTVDYHRNQSIERFGNLDGLDYTKQPCWGQFAESSSICNNYTLNVTCRVGLNDSLSRASMATRPAHIGSTVTCFDMDGDGDKDALIGDVSCPDINYLPNIGTSALAQMGPATANFPVGTQRASVRLFPAAYFADLDADGDMDMLVAPNVYGNNNSDRVDFSGSLLAYENTGSTSAPRFNYLGNRYWQRDMADFGAHAAPLFFDLDGDGLQELLVGVTDQSDSANGLFSTLFVFRNHGNAFGLDAAMLGLSVVERGNNPLIPYAHDFDGDGFTDLGLLSSGINGQGKLVYYPGLASPQAGLMIDLTHPAQLNFAFQAGQYPAFSDLDGDGDLDMLLGWEDGRLALYQHDGASFTLLTDQFLGLGTNIYQSSPRPHLADVNNNNRPDLLLTDSRGHLRFYADPAFLPSYVAAPDTLLYQNEAANQYRALEAGFWSAPTTANLDGDNLPDLVLGMGGGGLTAYKNKLNEPLGIAKTRPSEVLFNLVTAADGTLSVYPLHDLYLSITTPEGRVVLKEERFRKGQQARVLDQTKGLLIFSAKTETGRFQVQKATGL